MTTQRGLKPLQIGDSLCSAEALNVMVIGVHRIKDVPRETVWESGWVCVCVCVRKEERQEMGTGLQATVQTLLTQSLCYRQGRAHSRRDAGRVVWAKLPISPLLFHLPPPSFVGLLRYWKHHGGHGEQQVVSLVDFCLQAQAELKRNAVKRKAIRKEGIKERARLLGYSYYTHPRKAPKPLSSGGKTVTTDMPQSSRKCLPDKNRTQRDTEMLHAPYSQGHPQKKLLAVPYWF